MNGLEPSLRETDCVVLALDIDGVVVHPEVGLRAWDDHILADLGIEPSELSAKFFKTEWSAIVRGHEDLKAKLEAFLTAQGSRVAPEDFMAYWFSRDARVDQEVVRAARAWRDQGVHRCLVAVSNQERYRIEYLCENLKLNDLFDGFVWSSDLGFVKSEPDFFRRANEGPLRNARRVIFFDDEDRHVHLAREAGWDARTFVAARDLELLLS